MGNEMDLFRLAREIFNRNLLIFWRDATLKNPPSHELSGDKHMTFTLRGGGGKAKMRCYQT